MSTQKARDLVFATNNPENKRIKCVRGALIGASPDRTTIRIIPLFCHSWLCNACRPGKVRTWQRIIENGKPTKLLTLTCDPKRHPDPQSALTAMLRGLALLVKRIRRTYGPIEYVRVLEAQRSGFPHLHLAIRSKYIPQRWISKTWKDLNIGTIVDIRAMRNPRNAAKYITKYLTKAVYGTIQRFPKAKLVTRTPGYDLSQDIPPETRPYSAWYWRRIDAPLGWILFDLASSGAQHQDDGRTSLSSTWRVDTVDRSKIPPESPLWHPRDHTLLIWEPLLPNNLIPQVNQPAANATFPWNNHQPLHASRHFPEIAGPFSRN